MSKAAPSPASPLPGNNSSGQLPTPSGQTTDPLEALYDIQTPEFLYYWPPALGWWIVAIAALALFVFLAVKLLRAYQKKAHVREAKSEWETLNLAYTKSENTQELLEGLSTLLRRAALSKYPRHEVAGLTGEDWLQFLDRTGNTKEFSEGCGRALDEARYSQNFNEVNAKRVLELCQRWLKSL